MDPLSILPSKSKNKKKVPKNHVFSKSELESALGASDDTVAPISLLATTARRLITRPGPAGSVVASGG